MLDIVAPYGLSGLIRQLVLTAPDTVRAIAFAIMFAGYIYVLTRVFASIFCFVDYLLATTLRRLHLGPLSIQYWLGLQVERLPWRIAAMGWLLVIGAIAYDAIEYGVKPYNGSPLFQLKGYLSSAINWLWATH